MPGGRKTLGQLSIRRVPRPSHATAGKLPRHTEQEDATPHRLGWAALGWDFGHFSRRIFIFLVRDHPHPFSFVHVPRAHIKSMQSPEHHSFPPDSGCVVSLRLPEAWNIFSRTDSMFTDYSVLNFRARDQDCLSLGPVPSTRAMAVPPATTEPLGASLASCTAPRIHLSQAVPSPLMQVLDSYLLARKYSVIGSTVEQFDLPGSSWANWSADAITRTTACSVVTRSTRPIHGLWGKGQGPNRACSPVPGRRATRQHVRCVAPRQKAFASSC